MKKAAYDPEVASFVEQVTSGAIDVNQALNQVSKGNKDALIKALAGVDVGGKEAGQKIQAENLYNLANTILKHEGKNSAVGINPFARGQVPVPLPFGLGFEIPFGADYYTGKNADFIGKVQQMADTLTLAKLIEVKGQGATFGALSDSERAVIERAATPINQWVIKDKSGKVVGYNISQKAFDGEIIRLQNEYAAKAGMSIQSTSGTTAGGVGWSIDSPFQTTPSGVNYEIIQD
jgi:hypothetical protein